jgi:hypothetical protein
LYWIAALVQTGFVTAFVVPTVRGLDAESQRQWTFAQIATATTTAMAIISTFLKYIFAAERASLTSPFVELYRKGIYSLNIN